MKAALLPIAFALTAGAAFAEGPIQGNEVFNFQSTLSRAEVQAQAVQANQAGRVARVTGGGTRIRRAARAPGRMEPAEEQASGGGGLSSGPTRTERRSITNSTKRSHGQSCNVSGDLRSLHERTQRHSMFLTRNGKKYSLPIYMKSLVMLRQNVHSLENIMNLMSRAPIIVLPAEMHFSVPTQNSPLPVAGLLSMNRFVRTVFFIKRTYPMG